MHSSIPSPYGLNEVDLWSLGIITKWVSNLFEITLTVGLNVVQTFSHHTQDSVALHVIHCEVTNFKLFTQGKCNIV